MNFPPPLRVAIPLIVLLFGLSWGVINLLLDLSSDTEQLEIRIRNQAQVIGTHVAGISGYLYEKKLPLAARMELSLAAASPDIRYGLICDETDLIREATRYDWRGKSISNLPTSFPYSLLVKARETMMGQTLISEDASNLVGIFPFRIGLNAEGVRPLGVGLVILEYDLTNPKQAALLHVMQRELSHAIGLFLLCLAMWYLFHRTITQRVQRLVDATRKVASGTVQAPTSLAGTDEFASLSVAFDQMASDIEARDRTIRESSEALRANQERLQTFIRYAPVAIAMFDSNMRYLATSQRWISDYQLSAIDLVGRSHYEIFPEIGERWKAAHRQGLAGEVVRMDEDYFERSNGQGQWLRWELRPWKADDGSIGGIVMFSEDITEQKKTEAERHEAVTRFRALVEQTPAAIYSTKPDNPASILYISPQIEGLSGYSVNEWIEANDLWISRLHPDDRSSVLNALDDMLRRGVNLSKDYRFLAKDGTLRWVHDEARFVLDPQGKRLYIQGMLLDITDRIATERALNESALRMQTVLDNILEGIILIDEKGLIQSVNPAVETMFGYDRNLLLGENVTMLMPASYTSNHNNYINNYLTTGIKKIIGIGREVEGRRKDNTIFPIDLAVSEVRFDEQRRFIGVVRDITDVKRREDELRTSREQIRAYAQHLDAAIESERTRMAREIHDILGQALTAQKMDINSIRRRLLTPLHNEDIIALQQRIEEMSGLIDESIQVVRRIAGELRPPLLDRLGLQQAMKMQCRKFVERTGIACDHQDIEAVELRDACAIGVYRTFDEALTNIARHADASQVTVRLHERDDKFVLEIVNDGKAISTAEANNPKAFGLIGMRERANALGGNIQIQGVPGTGTVVRLELPISIKCAKGPLH